MVVPQPIKTFKVSKTADLIQELYKKRNDETNGKRIHTSIGASSAGEDCDRKIWMDFHWVLNDSLPNRLYHLFEEGNRQEDNAVDDLIDLGFDIRYTKEEQMRIDLGNNITCYPDGLIFSGVPEAPNKIHNFERKTMNTKDFARVKASGVKEGHPEHWYQIQVEMYAWNYMREQFGLDIPKVERTLYLVLCKETSEEYAERVDYDKNTAIFIVERLKGIANSQSIPRRFSNIPTWKTCKFCKYLSICHPCEGDEIIIPKRNCRTCRFSHHVNEDWICAVYNQAIPTEYQIIGCDNHCYHLELIPILKEDFEKGSNFSRYYYVLDENGKPIGAYMGKNGLKSDIFLQHMKDAEIKYHKEGNDGQSDTAGLSNGSSQENNIIF